MVSARLWPPTVSRRTQRAALAGALAYVAVVLAVWVAAYGGPGLLDGLFTVQVGPWLVYAFGGAAVVGATLAVSVDRYGLVGPTAAVACLFAVTVYQLWQALQSPAVLLVGDPFQIYLVGWPVVLAVAVFAGLVERYVRATMDAENKAGNAS
jgi:hypothetical protein